MTLFKLLETQAESTPDNIALFSVNESITYRELYRKANQLAGFFVQSGLTHDSPIFIELPKTMEAILAIWASLKIGACYVPINSQLPESSIKSMIKNCRPQALVCQSTETSVVFKAASDLRIGAIVAKTTHSSDQQLPLITWDELSTFKEDNLSTYTITESSVAYILHTSGSTGIPKGVEISHRAAFAFINWATKAFNITHTSRLACTSPLHFDLSVFDIFVAANTGATTVLVPQEYLIFPQSTKLYIEEQRISHLYTVPFFLTQVMNNAEFNGDDFPSLKHLLFAGEIIPPSTLSSLKERIPTSQLHNLYGPTETNVCSFYSIPRDVKTTTELPIGVSASSAKLFLVDENNCEVTSGKQGQIAVAGPSVMNGYVGLPNTTQEKVVTIRLNIGKNIENAYLTGDFGTMSPCGNLCFKGRKDEQIKRRGFRIELGEISNAIGNMDEIKDFGVVSYKNDQAQTLIGCCISVIDNGLTPHEVNTRLTDKIPVYMLPDKYLLLNTIPRTSTGKLNKPEIIKYFLNYKTL